MHHTEYALQIVLKCSLHVIMLNCISLLARSWTNAPLYNDARNLLLAMHHTVRSLLKAVMLVNIM